MTALLRRVQNLLYDYNNLTWIPATTSDTNPGSGDINIASDSVGLSRQNQLPASLGQKTSANSVSVVFASDGSLDIVNPSYALQLDDYTTANVTYVGQANTGTTTATAAWQIKKIDETTGMVITWADGDDTFSKVWNNRASLTYS